jgi:hypothetical protein
MYAAGSRGRNFSMTGSLLFLVVVGRVGFDAVELVVEVALLAEPQCEGAGAGQPVLDTGRPDLAARCRSTTFFTSAPVSGMFTSTGVGCRPGSAASRYPG